MDGRLLLTGVGGFFLGILLYSFSGFGWFSISYALLISALFFILWTHKKEATHLTVGVLALGILLGALRTELVPKTLPDEFQSMVGSERTIEGRVVADPDIRENNQRLTVELKGEKANTNVLVVAPLFPKVSYGETVRATGVLALPEPFETTGGRVFRYDRFLAKDGVFMVLEQASLEVVAPRSGVVFEARGALSDFKFEGMRALAAALPEPQASLAGGLILGGKQGLGKELLQDFITSGLVHIVVLSGYNVMIVADAVFRVFGLLSKQWAAGFAVATIFSFVLAAGAGAASIRAGIMAAIALYGRATGRTYDAFRALLVAGVAMLLWNPLVLAYDPGFQLSFIATLGLIFGAPLTERWFSFIPLKFLREIVSSTVAAQIAVLPLLLYQNGLLSLVALPANVLVLPFVPLAMLLSAIAGAAGLLLPSVAPYLGFPAYVALSYITGVVEIAANVPFAAISLPSFPFALVVVTYAALGVLVVKLRAAQSVSHTPPS